MTARAPAAREGWSKVRLADVCELRYGKSLPAGKRSGSGFPVYGSNGEVGRHDSALTSGATVVVGRKGSFGEVRYSADPCWPIDTTYYIDERSTEADLRWLFHLLLVLPLKDLNRAAAIPGLNREDAYDLAVLLPPTEEQRRIASLLDAADALRSKRRQALDKLDTLTQAAFIEIFERNGWDQWPTVPIEEVAKPERGSIRTGPFGSQLLHDEFTDVGIAVLGIDNAVHNEFRWGERRYISREKYEQLKRFTVYPGDVIVTIMGTCGRAAIVPDDIPVAVNTKHLCCITPEPSLCDPVWLWACLRFHRGVQRQLGATHGAVMPGLNMGKIKQAGIPLPPLDVQRSFATARLAVDSQTNRMRVSAAKFEELFASLQQRAFRGEL